MSIKKRIVLMLVAVAVFALGQSVFAQCPPNGWYCPVIPGGCILVGCQKKCSDCTYTCAYSRGRECPPLEMCERCR
jgi:hypothetical protein